MIVAESHRVRHLIGRLDRGADLIPALVDLCSARGVRCAEVRAMGTVEEVDLREFDQRTRAYRPARRFTTPFNLIHFSGNLAEKDGHGHLEAQVAISRERDNGIELIGGSLLRARVYAVDFVITAFDDVMLRRSTDQGTGLPLFSQVFEEDRARPAVAREAAINEVPTVAVQEGSEGEKPIAFEAPARGRIAGPAVEVLPPEPTWAEVAAVSSVTAAAELPVEEPLRAGDVVEHSKFGRCEVERVEGDAEFAQVRLRNGRLVRLSLDVLTIERDGMEGSRRRFRAATPR